VSEHAPEEGPPQAGPDEWLAARTRETRVMVQLRKRNLLQALRGAADPEAAAEAVDVPAAELVTIDRLETKLASRERITAIREMTRVRPR
jgi:hypothetical protein